MDRRDFLTLSSSLMVGACMASTTSYVHANPNRTQKRLAIVLLEGGMDGLAAVPPLGDKYLFDHRSDLIGHELFELNREFGLSRAMPNFYDMMRRGNGAIVHASGFPYTKRSHFEGQNVIQTGVKTPFAEKTGWIGRTLSQVNLGGRALSLSKPLLLRGYDDVDTIYPAQMKGAKYLQPELMDMILAGSEYSPLKESIVKIKELTQESNFNLSRDPETLAFQAGQAMADDNGPVVSFVRVGGFDTHAQQGVDKTSVQNQKLAELDSIFSAFESGLAKKWQDTIVLTITEFGRTVKMNGSYGTDHGFGSATIMAGGLLKSGAVVSDWPSLKKSRLFDSRDLNVTIDSRSIWCASLSEVFNINHETLSEEVFFDNTIPNISRYLFG